MLDYGASSINQSQALFGRMILAYLVICCCLVHTNGLIVGGFQEKDSIASDYMDKAWRAAVEMNEDNNDNNYLLFPIKVLSAKSQVVAGTLHEFEVLFGESNCKKGEMQATELSASNCQLKSGSGADRQIYKVILWEKPWENLQEFTVEKVRNVEPSEQL